MVEVQTWTFSTGDLFSSWALWKQRMGLIEAIGGRQLTNRKLIELQETENLQACLIILFDH